MNKVIGSWEKYSDQTCVFEYFYFILKTKKSVYYVESEESSYHCPVT